MHVTIDNIHGSVPPLKEAALATEGLVFCLFDCNWLATRHCMHAYTKWIRYTELDYTILTGSMQSY